jgi:hypothetical protein
MGMKDKFSVMCAWCDSWIDKKHEDHQEEKVAVSHGICTDCSIEVQGKIIPKHDERNDSESIIW